MLNHIVEIGRSKLTRAGIGCDLDPELETLVQPNIRCIPAVLIAQDGN